MLSVDDFDVFFREVHGDDPFPWQRRLLRQVVQEGRWPDVLDLPTGCGKTATMDIAVFHLALEAARGGDRRAPVRVSFVVDRRLVVDDAFGRARKLEKALADNPTGMAAQVATALRDLSGVGGSPLLARRLRGGIPRENDWARTPAQPTILCSTVDQLGSRLLFRGYGVSDSMKPVHAGLIGSDSLILLDEAHLAEPFRQTLAWVSTYRSRRWRQVDDAAPWGVTLLTATPAVTRGQVFSLDDNDLAHPVIRRRVDASKPARLLLAARARHAERAAQHDESERGASDLANRVAALVDETEAALKHFAEASHGAPFPAIGVVVNRVARARAVHNRLREEQPDADVRLLIGPARPIERDGVAKDLAPIRTGADRSLERALILVATQCLEVGVDIDLDGLITEVAPLDALRQRFGRLNRDGRAIVPYATIIAWKSDVSARGEDAVYGRALNATWERLEQHADSDGGSRCVQFGISAFRVPFDAEALSPRDDAPVLLPAHVDLLAQTSPVPAADAEVGLFLHGPRREPDSVTVVWRADVDEGSTHPEAVRRLLMLAPPRAGEAIELPVWAVRRWLRDGPDATLGTLADTATTTPDDSRLREARPRTVFRWLGDDERSDWVGPSDIRPGDTIVVPAALGGADEFGWNPEDHEPVRDVAGAAARPFAGRRFAVRVAPGLIPHLTDARDALSDALAGAESRGWKDLRSAVLSIDLTEDMRSDLQMLDRARRQAVFAYTDVYPTDPENRVRGVVFLAPLGIRDAPQGEDAGATEDDVAGSLPGYAVPLEQHCTAVADTAERFARLAGLPPDRQADLRVAGLLHDAGKADARFQAWLHYGDPLGGDPENVNSVLAKSGRELPRVARRSAGLPDRWRHEALSVRLAPCAPVFAEACDPELVLWLIGTHHGYGRTLFPHRDPEDALPRPLPQVLGLPRELPPGTGPQSLAFEWNGADWTMLHSRVQARYGIWELARMEAVLRLADHRTSEGHTPEGGTA